MFYDLHIHSCLSPCAEDEMTPNNICNMAVIKGLQLIAVTDHNSLRQLPSVSAVARQLGLKMLYGCELESAEEVHMLGLFPDLSISQSFQGWVDSKMPGIPNQPDFFGKEEICDAQDQVIAEESRLLLVSLSATLEECVQAVHEYGGRAILAHALDRKNSVTTQLGFIPEGLKYDGIELKSMEQKQQLLRMHPWIHEEDTFWFFDSDAHRLTYISEPVHEISDETVRRLWGSSV